MELLTKEILEMVPNLCGQDGKGYDAIAYAKFFDPCSNWTWFMTELDPDTKEAFGLVFGHEMELGYFSITELESVKNRMGLGIERDLSFKPMKLKDARELMRTLGHA